MDEMVFTILGCGSSGGVPRLGTGWGACDANNPKNRRRRCSLLIQRFGSGGVTTVLIDTSPDMREQLLGADIGTLDAVIYTHEHADHLHGMDDLRMIVLNMGKRMPVYASPAAQIPILARFNYAFVTPAGSSYPPILEMNDFSDTLRINGQGGEIAIEPITVEHGDISCTCIRVNDVAYAPDISAIPDAARAGFTGLECWILDALRYTPHPSHAHVEKALEWIEEFQPRRAILTDLHNDLDYATLDAETPENVTPAFDGMTLRYPLTC